MFVQGLAMQYSLKQYLVKIITKCQSQEGLELQELGVKL